MPRMVENRRNDGRRRDRSPSGMDGDPVNYTGYETKQTTIDEYCEHILFNLHVYHKFRRLTRVFYNSESPNYAPDTMIAGSYRRISERRCVAAMEDGDSRHLTCFLRPIYHDHAQRRTERFPGFARMHRPMTIRFDYRKRIRLTLSNVF